jgi:pterin-4a-carbinolamine dehydratase
MPAAELHSGWLDDVAAVAISGSSPITFAVCQDLHGVQEAREWLRSAIPSLANAHVEEVPASSLWVRLQSPPSSAGLTTWLIHDAAEGNNEELQIRWEVLNLLRDRLTEALRSRQPRNSVVFLTTVTRMPEIARHAPDLLAVSQVVTVSEEPFAVDPQDTSMMKRFQQSCRELEARYGLSTHELARRLLEREPTGVPEPDLSRWRALAQALREVLE